MTPRTRVVAAQCAYLVEEQQSSQLRQAPVNGSTEPTLQRRLDLTGESGATKRRQGCGPRFVTSGV